MEKEVVSLGAADTLDLADDIMRLGRIRHMPVVSRGKLVGILSQRDLLRAAISSALNFRWSAERKWLAKISVREVMTTDVITISPDAPVREAVLAMLKRRIGCLPVVEKGKLVGLLSETDCMRYLVKLLGVSDAKRRMA
jgi:CBS domain-containing protein